MQDPNQEISQDGTVSQYTPAASGQTPQPTTIGLGSGSQPTITVGLNSPQQASSGGTGTAQQPSMLGLSERVGFKKGGLVKAKTKAKTKTVRKSHRGDGCATRGFTKGRMY
jgi:hypothetical protein